VFPGAHVGQRNGKLVYLWIRHTVKLLGRPFKMTTAVRGKPVMQQVPERVLDGKNVILTLFLTKA